MLISLEGSAALGDPRVSWRLRLGISILALLACVNQVFAVDPFANSLIGINAGPGKPPLNDSLSGRVRSSVRLVLDAARTDYSGQFAPGTEAQEIWFAKPVRGRYFSLDAFSSQDGQPYAAVGELDLIDESGRTIPHTGWTVAYADSEEKEKENGSAENAIDGEAASFWHTQWSGSSPNFPHRLIVDLGRSQSVAGFRYVPRQGSPGVGGRIKNFCVAVGENLSQEKPPVNLLPEQCYLFSHFTDDDHDGLHLLWSTDGFRWQEVNRSRSVLKPIEDQSRLMRDPCLLQGPDGVFHLVWTCDWTGNRIGHATSRDLVHWSDRVAIPVMADEPATLNCWAPEIFWDAQRAEYLIIWSSTVTNRFLETLALAERNANDRLYCTTTKDFQTFSATRLFYDPGFPIIDATVLSGKDRFYLCFKDERSQPSGKNLRLAEAKNLQGPFGAPGEAFSPNTVEGPTIFRADTDFIAYFHYYGNNRFGAMRSKDLKHWENISERLVLPPGVHQGTVLPVSRNVLGAMWQAGLVDIGATPIAAELGIGNWIWASEVADKQTCRLWRSFDVPENAIMSQATLRLTADNGYRVSLDGNEIGRGGDLNSLTEYDLTSLIAPGTHVLAVEAFNDAGNAGVILGLQMRFSSGKKLDVVSDSSWRVVPRAEKKWELHKTAGADWPSAKVVAFAGRQVWERPERIITSPPLAAPLPRFWQRGWFLALLLSVCAAVVAVSVRQGLQLAVQSRSSRLLERERARIARDIHDDLGAGLTQLTLLGELVLREPQGSEEARGRLDKLCGKARALLGTMDEIIWAVNPRLDTVHDFAAFLCEHTQEFLSSTSIRCRLDVPDDLPPIPLDLPARRNLLLAVKEALRNVATHSGADELSLSIRLEDRCLGVTVQDNGRGFNPLEARPDRNGLRNLAERLADIGGSYRVITSPGKGCRVSFVLPLDGVKVRRRWIFFSRHKAPPRNFTEPVV